MVNNFANCMTSTSTGVPTEGVDAGGRVATLVVSFASGHDRGKSFTFGLVVRHVPVRTFADHGPEIKKFNSGMRFTQLCSQSYNYKLSVSLTKCHSNIVL